MTDSIWSDNTTIDQFFVMGRSLWPDLKDMRKNLKIDRSLVPDEVVRFLRSTCLNEYGIGHYVKGYFRSYGSDYKMGIWATLWGGEEYLHHVVLRMCLKAMGEDIQDEEFTGLEQGHYEESSEAYLKEIRVSPQISRRLQQLIYNVLQEYSAYVAYTSVSEAVKDEALADILRRMGRDEMRHCSFFQLALKEYAEQGDPEELALIWPQFRAIWNKLWMPQEHIELFQEQEYATDLYIDFWTPAWRSKMAIDLAHYFKQFRTPVPA